MPRIDDLKSMLQEKSTLLDSLREVHTSSGSGKAAPDLLMRIKEMKQEQQRLEEDLELIQGTGDGGTDAGDPPTVFISYSHKDELEKEDLLNHLRVLERAGVFKLWIDDHIEGGGDWQAEITQAIEKSDIVILLISNNFLLSDFIGSQEVPAFLERRSEENLVVFPLIAKYSGWWAFNWLSKMNVRPKNGLPIWRGDNPDIDKDLHEIAREIALIARKRRSAASN